MLKKVLTLSLSLLAMNAFADSYSTEGKVYAGLKLGKFMIDSDDLEDMGINVDDPEAFGFQLGYGINDVLSAEFSYMSGSSDLSAAGVTGDVDLNTMAFSLAFRSAGDVYLLAKAGILTEELDVTARNNMGGSFSDSTSDSGLTLGLGAGLRINNNVGLELEYTLIEEDVDFFGVSANVYF